MVHVDTAQRERFEFWQRLNDHFLPAKNHRNHGYNGFSNGYHQEEPLIPAESDPPAGQLALRPLREDVGSQLAREACS